MKFRGKINFFLVLKIISTQLRTVLLSTVLRRLVIVLLGFFSLSIRSNFDQKKIVKDNEIQQIIALIIKLIIYGLNLR